MPGSHSSHPSVAGEGALSLWQGRKMVCPLLEAHFMQLEGGMARLGAGPYENVRTGTSVPSHVHIYRLYLSAAADIGAAGEGQPMVGTQQSFAVGLLSQAACPSSPELQIHLDTCSEFRNKHIRWNSYFMRPLLGAYCKRND